MIKTSPKTVRFSERFKLHQPILQQREMGDMKGLKTKKYPNTKKVTTNKKSMF